MCELCLSGVVPSCMLEALKATGGTETPSPEGGAMFSKRTGLSVYRSLRRQRRRSVGGEIFFVLFCIYVFLLSRFLNDKYAWHTWKT